MKLSTAQLKRVDTLPRQLCNALSRRHRATLAAACFALLVGCLAPSFVYRSVRAGDEDGVRVDLPANSRLRVENARGRVSVEVWSEPYVAIVANIEGAPAKSARDSSPVSIERSEDLLSINVAPAVANRAAAASTQINLALRIPERTRAEIVTTSGAVEVRGVPQSLDAQTATGDVRAALSAADEVNVTATSAKGTVVSNIAGASERDQSNDAHAFQTTAKSGGKSLRLRSERGNITLLSDAASSAAAAPQRASAPPVLRGALSNAPRGAGVPSMPVSNNAPQEVDDGDVVRVDTQLVTLNASVVDRSTKRGVANLRQSDFKLYEDGVEQQIAHFEADSEPFNLVLLIDLSGSTQDVVSLVRAAALRFVAAARPLDRIGIITFANRPVIVSPLTSDRASLRQRINRIEQPHGSTKLYDALDFTIAQVTNTAKDSRRNAIVLMSDGLDSTLPNVKGEGSKIPYKELFARAQEFDGVIYSLWLNTEYEAVSDLDVQPETFDLAHDRLKELAEAGSGMFYEVEKLDDLAGAYERVVTDLGTVYSFAYRPSKNARDGSWRAIRLVVNRPNAVARGKRGYYAN